jgi:hypothetical protein
VLHAPEAATGEGGVGELGSRGGRAWKKKTSAENKEAAEEEAAEEMVSFHEVLILSRGAQARNEIYGCGADVDWMDWTLPVISFSQIDFNQEPLAPGDCA